MHAHKVGQLTNGRCKLLKTFALIWKYLFILNVFCYSSVCGGKSLRSVSEADLPSSSACTGHNCLQLDLYLRCFFENTCLKVKKIIIIIFAIELYLYCLQLNPCQGMFFLNLLIGDNRLFWYFPSSSTFALNWIAGWKNILCKNIFQRLFWARAKQQKTPSFRYVKISRLKLFKLRPLTFIC